MKTLVIFTYLLIAYCNFAWCQAYTEILGRPTNTSVTISTLFNQQTEAYWEYGTTSGNYSFSTSIYTSKLDTPIVAEFSGLQTNTKYYYRTRYRANGSSTIFLAGQEHSFHTQRDSGESFSFAVEADPHLDYNSDSSAYMLTLQNILSANPDFLLDLGDTFMSEKLSEKTQANITARHQLFRSYFGSVCHSVPLYLVIGNHEGEVGWSIDGTSNSLPVMASNTRKLYYPNPTPNSFYSGNTKTENYVGLRGNYYAWEWGNALFIVLDPYWYTVTKPDWGWTLGEDQYNWFKNVITTSTAKFKFIFCHQLVGGNGNDARGGAEYADFFEMGGKNSDYTYGFDTYRPGWGKSIHDLMVENNATIYFHGHDHLFAKQDKDGVVYQEVPQPSNKNISSCNAAQWGYVNGDFLPNRGFILVTVNDSSIKVDYIRTFLPSEENTSQNNGMIAYTYTIKTATTAVDNNNSLQNTIQCFPNPFIDKIKAKNICGDENYKLTNSTGQTIWSGKQIEQEDFSYLPTGLYILTIGSSRSVQKVKLIKNKN